MVIEDVEAIKKRWSFFDPTHSFPYRVHRKIWGKWPTCGFWAVTPWPVKRITSNVKLQSRIVGDIKAPNNCNNQSKGSPLWGDSLPKSGNFGGVPTPVNRLACNFVWLSGPSWLFVMPNFTWIGATSRPCGAKMLIVLWVNLIQAVCCFAVSCR